MRYRPILKWISVSLLLVAGAAKADMVFQLAPIRIEPVIRATSTDSNAVEVRSVSNYTVEVRGQDALRFDSIKSLNTLTDTTGVLIAFNAPSTAPLPLFRDFTPLDVALIAEDGTILKTAANVVLGEMAAPIASDDPVKAFLFLKAGQLAARNILERDMVRGSMFVMDAATTP